MVKAGEHKGILSTVEMSVRFGSMNSGLFIEVKDREYSRREVQEIVAELVEWLADTAPKEVIRVE